MPEQNDTTEAGTPSSREWEPMTLSFVGEVGEVLHSGGGKLSTNLFDPGDTTRKPPGLG